MVASNIVSSDDLPAKKPVEIRYDPELLSFADMKRTRGASAAVTINLLEKCITSWPYETKLAKGAGKKLPLEQSGEVINVILNGIGEDIIAAVKGVTVDFKKANWSLETLERLGELDDQGDFDGMIEMFREVCTWAGGDPHDPMNCIQGGAAYKAIMDKWNRIVSGKN